MNNHLQRHFLKLSKSGTGLHFRTVTCRYKKFTIYCIMGPEENLVQVTFARKKHERLRKLLWSLNSDVHITKLKQEEFLYSGMFADYFACRSTGFPIPADSPLIAAGTDFQQRVWRHISTIPYGSCITYQGLAELAGSPGGGRAAGTACGANPLALIIPCHRVVASNGLGGFAGGITVKKGLLALEQTSGGTGRLKLTDGIHNHCSCCE